MLEDPVTPRSYPSQWNRCFHVKPAAPLALEHQYGYCLSSNYPDCEIYKGDLLTTLPDGIRGYQHQIKKRKKYFIRIGATLSVLLLAGLLIWPGSGDGLLGFLRGGFSTSTPTPVVRAHMTPNGSISAQGLITPVTGRSSPTPLSFKFPTITPTANFTTTSTTFFLWNSLITSSPTAQSGGKVKTPIPKITPTSPTSTPIPR